MAWFPLLLGVHVALAVMLVLPSVVLPFALARSDGGSPGPLTRGLVALQGSAAMLIAAGVAITGVAMLWMVGPQLLGEPWLLVALALYAANLAVAAFISRPNLRRLVRLGSGTDEATWRRRARRQRLLAYGMAATIGVIALLMSTKPGLW